MVVSLGTGGIPDEEIDVPKLYLPDYEKGWWYFIKDLFRDFVAAKNLLLMFVGQVIHRSVHLLL